MLFVDVFVHNSEVEDPMRVVEQNFLYHCEADKMRDDAAEAIYLSEICLLGRRFIRVVREPRYR